MVLRLWNEAKGYGLPEITGVSIVILWEQTVSLQAWSDVFQINTVKRGDNTYPMRQRCIVC